jgi:Predicted integral membrane protein
MSFKLFNYEKEGRGVYKDDPKEKGLRLFFRIYKNAFWELMKLNLLFLLFSLPVVTVFASYAAMTRITCMLAQDKPVFLFDEFKRAFKQNFLRSTLYGFGSTIITALLVYAAYFYSQFLQGSPLQYIAIGLFVFLILLVTVTSIYFYPMQTLVDLPFKGTIKNSTLLGIAAMKNTLLVLLVLAAINIPVMLFFPITIILHIALLFSNCAYIISFGVIGPMKKYVIREPENSEPVAEE